MLKHRLHAVMVTVLLSMSLGACGGGGGDDNGGNTGGTNPSIDIQADAFKLTPATFDGVLPGESIEGSTKVSGFDGSLNATFTTTGPITATLRNGKTGKEAKSVDFKAGDTLFAKVTVNADAAAGDTFSLKLTVGSGDTEVSASLTGTVGDGKAPTISIDFPSKTSISTSHKTSITGRVADNVGIESVRIKELPGELVQLDDDGSWIFPGIPLAQGDNALTVEVTDVNGLVTEEALNVFRDTLWFEDPVAVHKIDNDRILVLDDATDTLYEINPSTGAQLIITSPETTGSENVPMRHPVDMTVDAANGTVYVANAGPQINGVIKVDLATGERTVLSSTIADPPAHFIDAGSGDNWTGLVTAVSFYTSTVYTAAGADFYAVFSDGRRVKRGTAGAPIIDIEAGTFPFGTTATGDAGSASGVVVLVDGNLSLRAVSDGHYLADIGSTGGRWLSRTGEGAVAVLEEPTAGDFDVNTIVFAAHTTELRRNEGTLNPEPADLLRNSTGAVLLSLNNYLVFGSSHAHPLYGKTTSGNTVETLKPNNYPDLSHGESLQALLTTSVSYKTTFDPVQRKAYLTSSSGSDFVLLQLDPLTGERKRILHGLDATELNLFDADAFTAHDGVVYLQNDIDSDPDEKDGIYAVDVDSCTGISGDVACVRPFFVNSVESVAADEQIIDHELKSMTVTDDEVVVVVSSYLPAKSGEYESILRFNRENGALISQVEFSSTINSSIVLKNGELFAPKKNTGGIFKTDVTTTDGGLILVSQCDDDKTIFSLTCNEFGTTYSNQKGIGPAVDRFDDMYSMGKGKLLVSLRAYVPSAFDKSVAADWVGYYLVDIRTGDRAFIRGYDPFDGNLGAGYYGGHAVTDVEGDRMLRHNFTNQFFEAINYRQATDVATGETYYPVDRVFIAH